MIGGMFLKRVSHYVRVRLVGLSLLRVQCTTCKAVFTVLPHFVLRYRQMRPEVARNALLATHGGLSLELCAVVFISPLWPSIACCVALATRRSWRCWRAVAGRSPPTFSASTNPTCH